MFNENRLKRIEERIDRIERMLDSNNCFSPYNNPFQTINEIRKWILSALGMRLNLYGAGFDDFPPIKLANQEDVDAILEHLKMKICTEPAKPAKKVLKKNCK